MSEAIIVMVTAPSADVAAGLARPLVEEGLVACCNIVPGVRSIYRWEGQICDDAEVLMIMESLAERFESLRARIEALHPYSCPKIVSVDIAEGHAPYLSWVAANVSR